MNKSTINTKTNTTTQSQQQQGQQEQKKLIKPIDIQKEQQVKDKLQKEKETKEKIKQNQIEKENEIRANEKKQIESGNGIEKTFTLVPNSLGHLEKKNDIDSFWTEKSYSLSMIGFLPSDNFDRDESQESVFFMNSDLSKLLKWKYNIFWSHVLLNQTLREFIDSFLQYYWRPYHQSFSIITPPPLGDSKDFKEAKQMLMKRVFAVIVRMSMIQEKSGQFIGKDYYIREIYSRNIFSIPKIIDICSLFAPKSKELVVDLVQRLFDNDPRFYQDLNSYVPLISKSILDLNINLVSNNHIDILKIEDSSKYLMDISYSIDCFLKVHPSATHEISKSSTSTTTATPESIFKPLKQHILGIFNSVIKHHFTIRMEQHKLSILGPCFICKKQSIQETSNQFVTFLGTIIGYSDFSIDSRSKQFQELYDSTSFPCLLFDYEQIYNISNLIIEFRDVDKSIDEVRLSYFMNMIGKQLFKSPTATNNTSTSTTTTNSSQKDSPAQQFDMVKISQVQDIFSDYGNYFIHCCLKYYNNNPEQVVNALFDESNLPTHLKSMDRKLMNDPKSSSSSTTSNNTSTTTTTTNTTNSSQKDSINELVDNVYELSIGKKTMGNEEKDKLRTSVKSFITNYELMYEDDYDDSMDVFSNDNVHIQDGESLKDDEEAEKSEPKQDDKFLKKPFHDPKKGYHHVQKTHNRKENSAKKRGFTAGDFR
eukprot:gene2112-2601_t